MRIGLWSAFFVMIFATTGCVGDPGGCPPTPEMTRVETSSFALRTLVEVGTMRETRGRLIQGVPVDATVRVDRENERVELSYTLETGEEVVEVYRIASTDYFEREPEPTPDPIWE